MLLSSSNPEVLLPSRTISYFHNNNYDSNENTKFLDSLIIESISTSRNDFNKIYLIYRKHEKNFVNIIRKNFYRAIYAEDLMIRGDGPKNWDFGN